MVRSGLFYFCDFDLHKACIMTIVKSAKALTDVLTLPKLRSFKQCVLHSLAYGFDNWN